MQRRRKARALSSTQERWEACTHTEYGGFYNLHVHGMKVQDGFYMRRGVSSFGSILGFGFTARRTSFDARGVHFLHYHSMRARLLQTARITTFTRLYMDPTHLYTALHGSKLATPARTHA